MSHTPINLVNRSLFGLHGFNYQPSFAANGVQRWLDRYDAARVHFELARGQEIFPWIKVLRIWLSHDAWLIDRSRFLDHWFAEVEQIRALGLRIMPVLFNGWHGMPDFGGLGPMSAERAGNKENLERIFLRYVADVTKPLITDAVVAIWDLCNEPWLHYNEPGKVRSGFDTILRAAAGHMRESGCKTPLGIGNMGREADDRQTADYTDCMLTHRYWPYQYTKFEDFQWNTHHTCALANELGKPWVCSEACWGRWDDAERADAAYRELSTLLAVGVSVIPFVLWESPTADCHGPSGGFTYEQESPGDLCFIRRDGSVRPGHERINELFR